MSDAIDLLSDEQWMAVHEKLGGNRVEPLTAEDAFRVMLSPLMGNDWAFFRRVLGLELVAGTVAAATARAERAEAANEDLTLAVKARDIAVREADRLRAVAETAIARVRHLHQPYRGVPDFDICAACSIGLEVRAWPCPTIAALDGTDNTGHAPGCLGDRGIVHQTCPACTAGGTE